MESFLKAAQKKATKLGSNLQNEFQNALTEKNKKGERDLNFDDGMSRGKNTHSHIVVLNFKLEKEDIDAGWDNTGSPLIGKRVCRVFDSGPVDGTVVAWNNDVEDCVLYRIEHDDADIEDLDQQEVDQALKLYEELHEATNVYKIACNEHAKFDVPLRPDHVSLGDASSPSSLPSLSKNSGQSRGSHTSVQGYKLEKEEIDAGWSKTGSPFIGKRLRRVFGNIPVDGTVVAWNGEFEDGVLYRIQHDDADSEDLDQQEVDQALKLYPELHEATESDERAHQEHVKLDVVLSALEQDDGGGSSPSSPSPPVEMPKLVAHEASKMDYERRRLANSVIVSMDHESLVADYLVGKEYRVLSEVTVREEENLASAVIEDLRKNSVVKVLEVGTGSTGRRLRVSAETCEGWVSCATQNGERLVHQFPIGSEFDAKEGSWFSAIASSLSPGGPSSPSRTPRRFLWDGEHSERLFHFSFPSEAASLAAEVVDATAEGVAALRKAKLRLPTWRASLFVDSPTRQSPWGATESHVEDQHSRKQEGAVYYYVYKLLSNRQKEAGLECMACLSNLQKYTSNVDVDGREYKQAMDEILRSVVKISSAVEVLALSDMQASTVDRAVVLPLIRPSVERCMFARSRGIIWQLYKERFATDDDLYAKRASDFRKVDPNHLLESLGVREELRWNAAGDLGSPYERAVAAMSHFGFVLSSICHRSPHELLHTLSMAYLDMKTCAIEASNGAYELLSMDDIMPVFLIVLTRSCLNCPCAAAAFMNDALDTEESMGSEGRAVVLLETAAQYIAVDWPGVESQLSSNAELDTEYIKETFHGADAATVDGNDCS